jgi:signal transduction histidine kinase
MLIHTGTEFQGNSQVPVGGSDEGGMAALKGSFTSFQHLQVQMKQFGRLIRQFRKPDELKSIDAEKNVEKIQSMIDIVIAFAIVFSVLMNSFLFLYFMKGINRGILNLLENTKRMSRAEPLLPELTTDDEFGHLDRAFHHMAREVESAKERQRALDRMKKEFFNMISHDMRTPLSSIVSAVDCLLGGICGELSERATQYLRLADQGAQYLLGLVQDLLDIERLSTGAFPLQKEDFDFAAVFRHAAEMVSPLASKSDIQIKVPEGSFECHGDKDALTRVIVNLVSNAIKFSPSGSSVDLSAKQEEEAMLVEVADHGRGIPEESISDVFDRFKQVDIADTKMKGGTGLGLAICKGFVEAHGGTIGVKSKPGEGSTFWFRIPMQAALASAAD